MSTSVRVTVAQYDAMIARGEFVPREDHHVELIDGEIVPMSPIGHPHETAVDKLNRWSFFHGPIDQIWVRVQNSIGIPLLDSVPEPDFAWVRLRSYDRRPEVSDLLLLVEVADSSLHKDLTTKARLYATAGVADYWVVDVPGRQVEVHRHPRDGAYRAVRAYRPGEEIRPAAFPEVAFPVAVLFPPERTPEPEGTIR